MNASKISTTFTPEAEKNQATRWDQLTTTMRSQSAWLILVIMLAAVVFIGWLDHITGYQVTLFIFYGLPILCTVWWVGKKKGFYMALVSGLVWWLANMKSNPYETHLAYAWAMLNRLASLFALAFAAAELRQKHENDEARIRMLEERRQLEKDIVSVSEHEQQRIGQDLHDGICQQLAAIGCAVRVLAEDLQAQGIPAAQDASMIEGSLQQVVVEARNLAHGIFPVHVDRSGLAAALADLGKMTTRLTGTPIVVDECADLPLDTPDVSMHLYRIAQEAVANAVKHSGATEIRIAMNLADNGLELRVEDNGRGIPATESMRDEGMGLRTMFYRAQALQARLVIEPQPQGGTLVSCRLPLKQNPKEEPS